MTKILFKLIAPIMVFTAIKKRNEYRSTVYNWVLQHNMRSVLSRLWQRNPTWAGDGWRLHDKQGHQTGWVVYRPYISKTDFDIAYKYWRWLDDDSNEDTTDAGYINSIVLGYPAYHVYRPEDDRTGFWQAPNIMLCRRFLPAFKQGEVRSGNSFDLGDWRNKDPYYNKWATYLWTSRNRGMNRQYYEDNY